MSSTHGAFPDRTKDFPNDYKGSDKASESAGKSASKLMEAAKSSVSDLASSASDLAGNAAETFKSAVEDQKTAGAGAIGDVARAAKNAADNFQDRAPELANAVRTAADRVEGISNDIRDRSLDDLLASVAEFAGQKPMAFFGCGILAGLRDFETSHHVQTINRSLSRVASSWARRRFSGRLSCPSAAAALTSDKPSLSDVN